MLYNWNDEDRWTRVRDAWSIALRSEFRARKFLCACADPLICREPSMQSQLLTANYSCELICAWSKRMSQNWKISANSFGDVRSDLLQLRKRRRFDKLFILGSSRNSLKFYNVTKFVIHQFIPPRGISYERDFDRRSWTWRVRPL